MCLTLPVFKCASEEKENAKKSTCTPVSSVFPHQADPTQVLLACEGSDNLGTRGLFSCMAKKPSIVAITRNCARKVSDAQGVCDMHLIHYN